LRGCRSARPRRARPYQAFINHGVPASGLFTGADGTKTPEEVELFGGTAGIIYDPNYHTPGDDLSNVNVTAIDIMSDAIAHATITLAQDTSAINGKRSAGKSGKPHPVWDQAPAA
jgi:Zn-dependent M28 family amino/carboxypeptidase